MVIYWYSFICEYLIYLLYPNFDWVFIYMKDGPPPHGIIFWRVGPLWYRLPPLEECSRNPSGSVYQMVVL